MLRPLGVGLGDVVDHIPKNAIDVLVGGGVKDLLAATLGPDQPRRLQKPQMVTDERGGDSHGSGDFAHVPGLVQATGDDPETRRITEQAKDFGDFDGLVLDHVCAP